MIHIRAYPTTNTAALSVQFLMLKTQIQMKACVCKTS